MTLKFTPELIEKELEKESPSWHGSAIEHASIICQRIFDEWLAKHPMVYGRGEDWTSVEAGKNLCTYQARLVCVEAIKPCAHEPDTKVIPFHIGPPTEFHHNEGAIFPRCKHCDIAIKASSWEAVE